jgi:hypothetical protein
VGAANPSSAQALNNTSKRRSKASDTKSRLEGIGFGGERIEKEKRTAMRINSCSLPHKWNRQVAIPFREGRVPEMRPGDGLTTDLPPNPLPSWEGESHGNGTGGWVLSGESKFGAGAK